MIDPEKFLSNNKNYILCWFLFVGLFAFAVKVNLEIKGQNQIKSIESKVVSVSV